MNLPLNDKLIGGQISFVLDIFYFHDVDFGAATINKILTNLTASLAVYTVTCPPTDAAAVAEALQPVSLSSTCSRILDLNYELKIMVCKNMSTFEPRHHENLWYKKSPRYSYIV